VVHVSTLRTQIDSAVRQIEVFREQIALFNAQIDAKRATIDAINCLCERVFRAALYSDDHAFIEAVREECVKTNVFFDPVNAREQFCILCELPDSMPVTTIIAAFAILSSDKVAYAAPTSRFNPLTVMTIDDDLADTTITLPTVHPQSSNFYATDDAVYALNENGLFFCRFDGGVMHKVEAATTAAFANGHVYYAVDTRVYEHISDADDKLILYCNAAIKHFAVFGDKIAVLLYNQHCALYQRIPQSYDFVAITAPFLCPNVSSVGICADVLVTAARKAITTYGAIPIKHPLGAGEDYPTIISGPRCLVQTNQGKLFQLGLNMPPTRLDLAALVWQPALHNGIVYYIDGAKGDYRSGILTQAKFQYMD